MFPSLHCNKSANALSAAQLGGANVLDLCSFKGAHTSDWCARALRAAVVAAEGLRAVPWRARLFANPAPAHALTLPPGPIYRPTLTPALDRLCELFGPSMAAYLVCYGTTPPEEVQTCGTAGWPNRRFSPATEHLALRAVAEQLAERAASSGAARKPWAVGAGALALLAPLVAAAAFALVRRRQRSAELLL